MNLTTDNTAIVLDSTADFPDAAQRFQNWRVVPLYVRFGDESYRDYVDLGPDYFDRRNADAVRRSLVKRLQNLGHSVTLAPAPVFS